MAGDDRGRQGQAHDRVPAIWRTELWPPSRKLLLASVRLLGFGLGFARSFAHPRSLSPESAYRAGAIPARKQPVVIDNFLRWLAGLLPLEGPRPKGRYRTITGFSLRNADRHSETVPVPVELASTCVVARSFIRIAGSSLA